MPVPLLAFLETIGTGELMMVLAIVLLLFGGDKLPEMARGMGKAMREFRKATGAMQDELKRAMEEEPTIQAPRPVSPEIKSTPGIQPPGVEAPATPADANADLSYDHEAPAMDPAHAAEIPADFTPPPAAPESPPPAPAAPAADATPPSPPRPRADPGAAA
jgi:TatA/E family protein of Tat protein translocase